MLMTGDEILEAYRKGEIVIDPFCSDNVNSASYDVSLGPFYYRQAAPGDRGEEPFVTYGSGKPGDPLMRVDTSYNPYDQQHVEATWRLARAVQADSLRVDLEGVDHRDLVISIPPKAIILAHTLEFIGSVPRPEGTGITTQMHSRSSSVRNCIDVCGSGGFGDHGFCSRWTLEVTNLSSYYTTYLVVGRRIAQISFWRTAVTQHSYTNKGKYQQSNVFAEVKASWTPSMLLPKMYQDREVGKPNPHRSLINKLLKAHPIKQ